MTKQQQNEKTEFVTRLCKLAQFCTFIFILYEIILQVLLTTNSTAALRKKILSKPEETRFEKILELARTLGLVESQTNTIENKTEINKIKTA
jgi:hypothetical protein